ncbi:hypothetical protein QQF64_033487, partial [Cirrhinus molitorella]
MLGSLDVLYSVLIHKLIAVYEEQEAQQRRAMSPGNGTRSSLNGQSSPEPYDSELACFQPIQGGEIEVNSSALKSSTPLLVRSSSDSALGTPQMEDVNGRAMVYSPLYVDLFVCVCEKKVLLFGFAMCLLCLLVHF